MQSCGALYLKSNGVKRAELVLTVSSSQVRGHEGPQLLNTEPEMSEH